MSAQDLLKRIEAELKGLGQEEQQEKAKKILEGLSPEELAQLQQTQCPFCAIAQRKIQSHIVYEDDNVMAILDINPATKGHTLLFPKNHHQILSQLKQEEIAHIFKITNMLSKTAFEALKAEGTNIFIANGATAGQKSPHVLIHIIPRYTDDGINFEWEHKKSEEKELVEIAENLRKNIKLEDQVIDIQTKKEEEKQEPEFELPDRIP